MIKRIKQRYLFLPLGLLAVPDSRSGRGSKIISYTWIPSSVSRSRSWTGVEDKTTSASGSNGYSRSYFGPVD